MSELTKQKVEEILARAKAATEGPWAYVEADNVIDAPTANRILELQPRSINVCTEERKANGRFAAHSREDVPTLCTALLEAWDKAALLEANLSRVQSHLQNVVGRVRQIERIANGEDQVAEDDTEGLEAVRKIAHAALGTRTEVTDGPDA